MTPSGSNYGAPKGAASDSAGTARLRTLADVAASLTSALDLDQLVHEILSGAMRVLPTGDVGILYLYDPASRLLRVKQAIGVGPAIYKITLKPGESFSGQAFLHRRTELYADDAAAQSTLRGRRPSTARYFELATGISEPASSISAALVHKGEALGALVVHNLARRNAFGPFDVDLLDSFAQFVAIALTNGRRFEQERDSRSRLAGINETIGAQRDALQRRLDFQQGFAEVLRAGMSFHEVVTKLARLTGTSVVLGNPIHRIRASSPDAQVDALAQLYLDDWSHLQQVLTTVRKQRTHQWLNLDSARRVLVTPVIAAGSISGYLLVECPTADPDCVDPNIVDFAASMVAAALLAERARDEAAARKSTEIVDSLLTGDVADSTATSLFGLPRLLALGQVRQPAHVASEATPELLRAFEYSLAERLSANAQEILSVIRGDTLLILSAWDDKSQLTSILEATADRMTHFVPGCEVLFAIGDSISAFKDIPAVYQECLLALDARSHLHLAERVINVNNLGAFRLILRSISTADASHLAEDVIKPLLEQDARTGGSLLDTYRIYLHHDSSVGATAKALGVHSHTVQYRLHRIQDLTGLNLRHSEDRLTLELALRVHDLALPASSMSLPALRTAVAP